MIRIKKRIILAAAAAFLAALLFSLHLHDNSKINNLKMEISTALDSLDKLDGKIATLKSDSTRFADELSAAQKKTKYMKETIQRLESENDSIKATVNALVRKAESLRATIESLTRSLDDEIAKRKLADELAAQISADARDDRRFAKAKADTLNKVRYHLAPNLAVFVAGINEPSCRTLHGCLQKFLKPLCDAQVRFVYGPNGRGFRSVAKKLGGLDYEALYKFAEVRSLNPEDPSYKNLRRQLESIINSGDFIRWAEVFGCDSVTASNAEWVAKNIIQIN